MARPRKRDSQVPLREFLGLDPFSSVEHEREVKRALKECNAMTARLSREWQQTKQQLVRDGTFTPAAIREIERKAAAKMNKP